MFDNPLQKLREILEIERENRYLLRIIFKHLIHKTAAAEIRFGDIMAATPGTQAVGSTLTAIFVPFEADGATVTPGSTLSTPPTWMVDNLGIATIASNPDGSATITGVSAGTVTVTATGGVFIDSDGVTTSPLTATNTDTITQTAGRTVSAQINFV